MSLTGFEVYQTFIAIQNHFHNHQYDYFKYNGKIKASFNAFNKDDRKWFYGRLAKKFLKLGDLENFIVSNCLANHKIWVDHLVGAEAEETYVEWQKRLKA